MTTAFFPPLPPVETDYDMLHRWLLTENVQVSKLTAGSVSVGVQIEGNYDAGAGAGWFINGDGSAFFGSDVVFGGDLYSDNWDGTIPPSLAAVDTGATTGWAMDSSQGTAQFSGDIWLRGDMELSSTGEIRTGGATSDRVVLSNNPYIQLFEGTTERLQISSDGTVDTRNPTGPDNTLIWAKSVAGLDIQADNEIIIQSYGASSTIAFNWVEYFIPTTTWLARKMLELNCGGSVDIYHDGTLKWITTATGWLTYGGTYRFYDAVGTQEALRLWSDGSNSYVDGYETGATFIRNVTGTGLYLTNDVANQDLFIRTDNGTGAQNRIFIDGSADLIALYTHDGVNDFQFHNGNLELLQGGRIYFDGLTGGGDWIQSGTNQLQMYIAGLLELTLGATGFVVPNVYNQTPSGTANVVVDTSGQMHRASSSKRYKHTIKPWQGAGVLDIEQVTFGMYKLKEKKDQKRRIKDDRIYLGAIAEQVDEVFPVAVVYDEHGRPDSIDWNAITTALISVVKDQQKRIERLEAN